MKVPSSRRRLCARLSLIHLALLLGIQTLDAGSATWKLDPTSGDWDHSSSWSPETVPHLAGDIATFDLSNQTTVKVSADVYSSYELDSIVFNRDAPAYTIFVHRVGPFRFSGAGTVNASVIRQTIVTLSG